MNKFQNWFFGSDRRATGFLVIGFASLVGGIFIFAFIVLPSRQPDTGVPRDVQLLFTNVYSKQQLVKNELGRFTPAIAQVGVEPDECMRYSCRLLLDQSMSDYTFQLSKEGQTWRIKSQSPMPEEVKE